MPGEGSLSKKQECIELTNKPILIPVGRLKAESLLYLPAVRNFQKGCFAGQHLPYLPKLLQHSEQKLEELQNNIKELMS